MSDCESIERLIGRAAGAPALTGDERRLLDAHLDACPSCRSALDDQQQVAALLRSRPPVRVGGVFASRLAQRLDREDAGWLELANWRAWTVGLVPIAAALVLMAYLVAGSASTGTTITTTPTSTQPVTFDTLVAANVVDTPAAIFLQPSATGDVLLESVLIGSAASGAGPYEQ